MDWKPIVKISGDFQVVDYSTEEASAERERILRDDTGEFLRGVYVDLGMVLEVLRSGGGEAELGKVLAGCGCNCNVACLNACKSGCQVGGCRDACKTICKQINF